MTRGRDKTINLRVGALLLVALFVSTPLWAKTVARNIKVLNVDSEGFVMSRPTLLFFDPNHREVYVTDEGKSQLVVYGSDYYPKLSLGAGRGLSPVYGIFVRDDRVYASVGDSRRDEPHILVMNKAFLPLKKIYFAGFEGAESFIPRDLVVSADGTIYVVAQHASFVIVLNQEGDYLRTLVPKADHLGVLEASPIVSLDIDREGNLYFLSEKMSKVFVYNEQEKPLYSFGEKGGVPGKLSRPRGLEVDEVNRQVYIVDWLRHAVSAYSMDGVFLFEFGGKGVGRGWFQFPTDICQDAQGNLFVSDTFNDRIQVFKIMEVDPENEFDSEEIVPVVKRVLPSTKKAASREDSAEEGPLEKQGTAGEKAADNWIQGAEGAEPADF